VTDAELRSKGPLRLTLEFESAAGKLYLECVGEIVRVEKGDGKIRVAAKITDSRLERRSGKLKTGSARMKQLSRTFTCLVAFIGFALMSLSAAADQGAVWTTLDSGQRVNAISFRARKRST
jgi:hypothetical protein